ncbi:Sodium/calcium exchanger MaX1 [Candidatus Norongarragalina meridionalis]|nr:Sodium/calcium exchanger MaX1 [Candidatus Norongarragalina meridionalis]
MFAQLSTLILVLLVLGYANMRLIRELGVLSIYLKLPKFFIAFILLGLGTSLPDTFVAANAAARGQLPLVIGSIIGANIIVLCLVLGIVTIVKGNFRVREKTILENVGWIFFVIMIPFFLLVDGRLTFLEGIILLVVYLMYVYNVKEQETFHKKTGGIQLELGDEAPKASYYRHGKERAIAKALVYLGIIVIAADIVVTQAVDISHMLGIPEMVIGFGVVALGITVPELILNLNALKQKEEEVIWGDIIGSFITELTFVLGVAALFNAGDKAFNFGDALVGYAFMAISFLLVFFFTYNKKQLTRSEGVALILLYLVSLSLVFDLAVFGGA